MFEKFNTKFTVTTKLTNEIRADSDFIVKAYALNEFLTLHAGSSLNNGLYRIHDTFAIPKWNKIVGSAFPDFSKRIFCFGYDWLGRHFALDSENRKW